MMYMWAEFLKGLGTGLGFLVGIVIGTVISILTKWHWENRIKNRRRLSLQTELSHNIAKLDEYIEVYEKLGNYASANNLANFFWYPRFEEFIGPISDSLIRDGLLFEFLTLEEAGELQRVYNNYVMQGSSAVATQRFLDIVKSKDCTEALKESAYRVENMKIHKKILVRLRDKLAQGNRGKTGLKA